eukprot:CAMPEP_0184492208 /NCGR_PEP_ID=MMETSP0113_2-20130426/22611_1 /TAXON_ID=91329 /ORGANISM="Norrisiella sphaerica, Strain BC52" /LENGTH=285 /DNA_ID=CAMNT_0026876887 /DNA_START=121 /DNA_END=978 /DNA_ORIENTATION=+
MSRPEHLAPPDIFYNEMEAKKYAYSTRMIEIQSKMSERALELLNLPNHPCHILDIGCGSGLSGEVLSENDHIWVGVDISKAMLGVAVEREVLGDLVYADAGDGLMFRPGSFDACISISAIQWLCNADKTSHIPKRRIKAFFVSLYRCLRKGARAVMQFYPENAEQTSMLTNGAQAAGFSGGLVVDYPNSTKAKKYFLCLVAGEPNTRLDLPKAMDDDGVEVPQDTVLFTSSKPERRKKYARDKDGKRVPVKSRKWIVKKKQSARLAGKRTKSDSKYTGRRRGPKF